MPVGDVLPRLGEHMRVEGAGEGDQHLLGPHTGLRPPPVRRQQRLLDGRERITVLDDLGHACCRPFLAFLPGARRCPAAQADDPRPAAGTGPAPPRAGPGRVVPVRAGLCRANGGAPPTAVRPGGCAAGPPGAPAAARPSGRSAHS